ncbi:MAG: hypothetical protein GY749_08725 [Desulfobacteraceae bacterium]|nr:hypothetical protein [Desulfobacteraceae bacterium]
MLINWQQILIQTKSRAKALFNKLHCLYPPISHPGKTLFIIITAGLLNIFISNKYYPTYYFDLCFLLLAIGIYVVIKWIYKKFFNIYEALKDTFKPEDCTLEEWFEKQKRFIFESPIPYIFGFSIIAIIFFILSLNRRYYSPFYYSNIDLIIYIVYCMIYSILTGLLAYIYIGLFYLLIRIPTMKLIDNKVVMFEKELRHFCATYYNFFILGILIYIFSIVTFKVSPAVGVDIFHFKDVFKNPFPVVVFKISNIVLLLSIAAFVSFIQYAVFILQNKVKWNNIEILNKQLNVIYNNDLFGEKTSEKIEQISQINQLKEDIEKQPIKGGIFSISKRYTFIFIALLLFIISIGYELTNEILLVEPFEIVKTVEEKGFNSKVVARKLIEKINYIQKEAAYHRKEEKKKLFIGVWSQEKHKIEVPSVGVSMGPFIKLIRRYFGIESKIITGEITCDSKETEKFILTVRINGMNPKSFRGELNEMDDIFSKAAEHVSKYTQPLILSLYYYFTIEDDEKCIDILSYIENNNPDKINHYFNDIWGCAYGGLHKYEDAYKKFKKALSIRPDYSEAYVDWSISLLYESKYNEAYKKFKKALSISPNYAGVYVEWGNILTYESRYKEAYEKFKKALSIKPDFAEAYVEWGEALSDENSYEKAYEKFKKAVSIKPDYVWTYLEWGKALTDESKHKEAYEKFEKAVSIRPDYALAYLKWGKALTDESKHKEAYEKFEKAVSIRPDYAWAYLEWGKALTDESKHKEAYEKFEKVVSIRPSYAWAYLEWGKALTDESKHKGAYEKFEKAASVWTNYARIYVDWGKTLAKESKYKEAYKKFKKAVSIRPSYKWTYVEWGKTLADESKYKEAYEKFKKAVSICPNYERVYVEWGKVLADESNYKEAYEKFKRAVSVWPDYTRAYVEWAIILAKENNYNQAYEKIEKALSIKPSWQRIYLEWGKILAQDKKYKKAYETFKKGIEIKPNDPDMNNEFAWFLATCPDKNYHDGKIALRLAIKASETVKKPEYSVTLAVALAETGNLSKAAEVQKKAIEFFSKKPFIKDKRYQITTLNQQLENYKKNKPWKKTDANYF